MEIFAVNPKSWKIAWKRSFSDVRWEKIADRASFLLFAKTTDTFRLEFLRVHQDFARPFTPIGEEEEETK